MSGMPLWVSELADEFWNGTAQAEEFPRPLSRQIARQLPVTVVSLPALRVAAIDDWLRQRAAMCAVNVPDRPIRACLVARFGHGIIFVDGADPEDELRFSLAHEVAHFLRHYWSPRRTIRERLGERALEVLDGLRGPDHSERSHALLTNVTIGFYLHLMDRSDANPSASRIDISEREADLLAFELLAPELSVRHEMRQRAEEQATDIEILLRERYGLPEAAAKSYADLLSPPRRDDSFLRTLGLVR